MGGTQAENPSASEKRKLRLARTQDPGLWTLDRFPKSPLGGPPLPQPAPPPTILWLSVSLVLARIYVSCGP